MRTASNPFIPLLSADEADETDLDPRPLRQTDGFRRVDDNASNGFRSLTDDGNALRLIDLYGDRLLYVPQWETWLVWDKKRWCRDERGYVVELARKSARFISTAEAMLVKKDDDVKALNAWSKTSQSAAHINAAISLARSDSRVNRSHKELDCHPWFLNVANGTIDLQSGYLYDHDIGDQITKLVEVAYDPDATAPRWEKFLLEIMDGNAEMVSYLQRAAGYSLTGSTREECMFVMHGTGRNGKTKFIEAIRHVLGDDYAQVMPAGMLMTQQYEGVPTDVARLEGARFASGSETEKGRVLAESKVKQITGGDKVAARKMRQDFFEFYPQCKIWLATNSKPRILGGDHGIWSRIRLIPFEVRFEDEQQDQNLGQKLLAEREGILAWMVAGAVSWHKEGLRDPVKVLVATRDYRNEEDPLSAFLSDADVVAQGMTSVVPLKDLLAAFKTWHLRERDELLVLTSRQLSTQLQDRGYAVVPGSANKRVVSGIGLKVKS
jgi:putative DNA primase/helicase